jgi:aspartate racemase
MKDKSIGILGLGNRSTLFYIDELNKKYNALFKGFSTCPFILYNTDFDKINPYLPNQFDKLKPLLSLYINNFNRLGINFLLIPNITLHESIDKIYTSLDIAHPVQLTVEKLLDAGYTKAVVFGSLYTMQSTYLKQSFQRSGISFIEPKIKDQKFLDYFRKQIYYERETEMDKKEYERLLILYSKDHPLVIACTELSIFASKKQPNIFDMAALQIEKTLTLFKTK